MRSYYWDNFRFNQMLIIIKLELQIKATYRTESFKYPLFPTCVSELNSLQKTMRGAESIKHFKSMLIQFFTLFSRCFQYITKQMQNYLRGYDWNLATVVNLKFRHKFKDCLRLIVTLVLKFNQLNTFFLRCQFLASKKT